MEREDVGRILVGWLAVCLAVVGGFLVQDCITIAHADEPPPSLGERACRFLASRPGGQGRAERERAWVERLAALTEAAAQPHPRIRPELVLALAFRESSWQVRARGGIGEHGLLQVAPSVLPGRLRAGEDPHDPAVNLRIGVAILDGWIDRCGGTEADWIAHYGHGHCATPDFMDRTVVRWAEMIRSMEP